MGVFYVESSKPTVSKLQASSVTASLASTSLFKYSDPCLSMEARSEVTYQRAKAIARAYGMSLSTIWSIPLTDQKLQA